MSARWEPYHTFLTNQEIISSAFNSAIFHSTCCLAPALTRAARGHSNDDAGSNPEQHAIEASGLTLELTRAERMPFKQRRRKHHERDAIEASG
jgi:hypothetical protein